MEAYRYFPRGNDQRTKGQRFVYHGNTPFEEDEEEKYRNLEKFLRQNRARWESVPLDYFDKAEIMKIFWAVKFDMEETLNSMVAYHKWRLESLPIQPEDKGVLYLEKGFGQIYGRDYKFRPCIIMNFGALAEEIRTKTLDTIALANCMLLLQEYAINNMFLPGQIENWVIIVDIAGQGLSSLPRNELKGLAGIWNANYRSRMGRTWILNVTWGVKVLWKVFTAFMDPLTVEKIHLTDKNTHSDLNEYFHPEQLLERYGGTGKEPLSKWPPVVAPVRCDKPESKLVSEQEYLQILEKRPMLRRRPDLWNEGGDPLNQPVLFNGYPNPNYVKPIFEPGQGLRMPRMSMAGETVYEDCYDEPR